MDWKKAELLKVLMKMIASLFEGNQPQVASKDQRDTMVRIGGKKNRDFEISQFA
jgi:hypothetical protein